MDIKKLIMSPYGSIRCLWQHSPRTGFLILFVLATTAYAQEHELRSNYPSIRLDSPLLKMLDGKEGLGIGGNVYGMIMKLRLHLKNMRFGAQQKDKTFVGIYTWEEKPVTFADMIAIEESGTKCSSLLLDVKKEFNHIIQPLLNIARGSKKTMVTLISEFSAKAHLPHTVLLDWAHTPEGQEEKALEEHIHTFKAMDQFLDDLIYYLESLLRSCPKARKQFEAILAQKISAAAV